MQTAHTGALEKTSTESHSTWLKNISDHLMSLEMGLLVQFRIDIPERLLASYSAIHSFIHQRTDFGGVMSR